MISNGYERMHALYPASIGWFNQPASSLIRWLLACRRFDDVTNTRGLCADPAPPTPPPLTHSIARVRASDLKRCARAHTQPHNYRHNHLHLRIYPTRLLYLAPVFTPLTQRSYGTHTFLLIFPVLLLFSNVCTCSMPSFGCVCPLELVLVIIVAASAIDSFFITVSA